jgi:methyltransferase-like protein
LIAQAYLHRGSSFVGVDLSQRHIDDAKSGVSTLGLANCEFRQMDVMEMSAADFGKFDYITAHGLFSWIPDMARVKVLELYRALLSENGVGYISYSVYPGAHQREMVQRAMRYGSGGISDPTEKVEKAAGFLKFLVENTTDRGIYKAALSHELNRHASHQGSDIYHDDLSELNQAFYFHEFADLLGNAGLQYLAEAELHAMGTSDISPDAREFIDSVEDVVEREQYLDLLRGRVFRQTLVCHREMPLQRKIDPAKIDRFMTASGLRPVSKNPDLAFVKIEKFVDATGAGIQIDQPLTTAMLSSAGELWPRAVPFPELVENGKRLLLEAGYQTTNWEQQENISREVFSQIARNSTMVTLHTYQPQAFTEVSETPRINALVRYQLKAADHIMPSSGIDTKIEDDVSRRLLELLDGTRDKAAVLTEMRDFVRSADRMENRGEILKTLPEWIDESIRNMGRIGVFEA